MDVLKAFLHLVAWLVVTVTTVTVRLVLGAFNIIVRGILGASTTFGSARWANFFELIRGGVLSGNGLIVGKVWGRFLRFNQDGYAILFAPTRSGKGVGVVIPNLLAYQGSIICTDPKGENSAITARHRASLGPVFVLNAINPTLSDTFNPLDMVRIGTYHEADDALELAKLLVIPESAEGHWDTKATQLIQALILFVCRRYANEPDLRNLAKVRGLVALGWGGLESVMKAAADLGSVTLAQLMTSFQGVADTPEAKSVMSNAEKAMALWSADRPAGLISMESGFRFEDFNRRTMTCFIMVDEEKLQIYASFLRVMMGCALMAMTRAKQEAPPKVPTLLLLDEAAAMGRIEPLETGVGYLATYARLLLVFQDLDQITRTYPKARSMIANAGCKIAFGVNDVETAKMLSQTLGMRTTTSHSASESRRSLDPSEYQWGQSTNEAGRALLDLSEILRLPRKQAIVLFNGPVRFPVLGRKVRYYRERAWRGLWDPWRRSAEVVELPQENDQRAA